MVKPAYSLAAQEQLIRNAKVVHDWKKRSKARRSSIADLSLALGLSRQKTRYLINKSPKMLVVARQKVRVIQEAASRVVQPVRRRETATKLESECEVTAFSTRTTQRLRKPYREAEIATRKAAKEVKTEHS
jgi:TATA-box binding protein (TBP) (component of TFIID and TFIIIB)